MTNPRVVLITGASSGVGQPRLDYFLNTALRSLEPSRALSLAITNKHQDISRRHPKKEKGR